MKTGVVLKCLFIVTLVPVAASLLLCSGDLHAQLKPTKSLEQPKSVEQPKILDQPKILQKEAPPVLKAGVTVTSITPQKVNLFQGGGPVVVEVKGANLASIDSVQVTRGGVEAAGIEETLDRSQLPGLLKITLKATPQAQIAVDCRLSVFDAGGKNLLEVPADVGIIIINGKPLPPEKGLTAPKSVGGTVPKAEPIGQTKVTQPKPAIDTVPLPEKGLPAPNTVAGEVRQAAEPIEPVKKVQTGAPEIPHVDVASSPKKLYGPTSWDGSITSSSPRAAVLAQGAEATMVELTGEGLTQIGAVQVMRNGVEAQGIEESIVSRSPSVLRVSLKASLQSQAASDYLLSLIDNNQQDAFDVPGSVLSIEVKDSSLQPQVFGAKVSATKRLPLGVERPQPQPRIVFLSSAKYTGDLGGISGADAKCTSLAHQAGLSGTFKAWLSDSSSSPSTSFTRHMGPYVLRDGRVVAESWNGLVSGQLLTAINVNEHGAPVHDGRLLLRFCPGDEHEYAPSNPNSYYEPAVWTNTTPNGMPYGKDDYVSACSEWVVGCGSHGYQGGGTGTYHSTDVEWTRRSWMSSCARPQHLYCFQQ